MLIVRFLDAYAFDVPLREKDLHPHRASLIPFDTYNLFLWTISNALVSRPSVKPPRGGYQAVKKRKGTALTVAAKAAILFAHDRSSARTPA